LPADDRSHRTLGSCSQRVATGFWVRSSPFPRLPVPLRASLSNPIPHAPSSSPWRLPACCLTRFFILTGPGLASLAAAIFPKTVPKSLCSSDLLRPKIGFDLPHSRHSGSSAEIPSLHWPLVTGHYSLATRHSQRSTVFPPTSPSSPGLANAHRPLPTVVPKSGSFCCPISERNDLKSLSDNCLKPKEIGFDLALFRHFISSAEISLLHWPLATDH
jgi:hypothetical protein